MVAFLDLPSGAKRDFVKSPVREFRTPGSVRGHPGERVLLPRYAPEIGRWPSRDPIEEKGGINTCQMLMNNVITRFDFLGQSAFVFVYDTYDPNNMFETWANATRDRIVANRATYFGDTSLKFDAGKDTIHFIPVNGPDFVAKLAAIKDVAYLGSFGHGKDGKIWWAYRPRPKEYRAVVTGIPGYRLNSPDDSDVIDFESLVLDFERCFVVEFYHCSTASWFSTDEDGTLMFPDETATQPIVDGSGSGKESIISFYRSLLIGDQVGYHYSFQVYGSVAGVSNGLPGNRGWPYLDDGGAKKGEAP